MGYHPCHTSSGLSHTVKRTRHWLTPQSVGSVSKLTFSLKSYVDKLAVMLWVLVTFLPLHMSWALLCTNTDATTMHACKCIFHIHGRFINTHVAVGRLVWKHIFLSRGRANTTKQQGWVLCFHFAPAIVVCKSCEVRTHFTSLKAKILTAVSPVEAWFIHTAVTFSASED